MLVDWFRPGEKYSFGRARPYAKSGIVLEELCVLCVETDHSISGATNSNESYWDISGDDSLYFLSEGNEITTSFQTVDQRNGTEILLGNYTGGHGFTSFFHYLHPYRPICGSVHVAVPTCPEYADKTLPPLLEGLTAAGVPEDRVTVFVNNDADKTVRVAASTCYTDYTSWEYTALIEVAELDLPGDYWFLLHDTCEVGPGFWEAIHTFNSLLPFDIRYVSLDAMTNIGMYSSRFLRDNRTFLHEHRGISKKTGIRLEGLHGKGMKLSNLASLIQVPSKKWEKTRGREPVYGTAARRTLSVPSLHLSKYQANFNKKRVNAA